jgi:hypothetical protein
VWLTVTTGALLVAPVARPGVARMWGRGSVATGALTFDGALVEVASCAVLGCAAWLWLTTTVTVAQALRGRPVGGRSGVRRWVLVACGVAALAGSLPPASAAPGHHGPAPTALPYPDRAVAPLRPTPPPPERAHTVVVGPGDSLWSIAADDLGPGAGDAEITERWHALYAANRGRIGPDADLVEPGLRLLLPRKDPS